MKTIIKLVSGILLVSALAGCTPGQIQMLLRSLATPPVAAGDPVHGESIFRHGSGSAPPCVTCHQIVAGGIGFSVGPNLADIAHVAETRVEGMDASAYIHQSILDPSARLVPGYRNMMYPNYAHDLSAQDIEDVVAFLLTLDGENS